MMEPLLFQGVRRVPKTSARVEAYGSVDELIAWIGLLALTVLRTTNGKNLIIYIQDQLMRCAAALASEYRNGKTAGHACPMLTAYLFIEEEIDKMDESAA